MIPGTTTFKERFPKVLKSINAEMGMFLDISIEISGNKDLNVEVLCVAAVYLTHNLERNPSDASLPNIDTLASYDFNNFRRAETLIPYARCLQSNCNNADNTGGNKKAKITTSPEKVYFDYLTVLIRYLPILQQKRAHRVTSTFQLGMS